MGRREPNLCSEKVPLTFWSGFPWAQILMLPECHLTLGKSHPFTTSIPWEEWLHLVEVLWEVL